MNVHFRFRFGRKWNFIFVGILVYGRKWIFFRSASSIHHKKVLVLVLRCKVLVLVLVLNTRLGPGFGLGLEIILKSWSWSSAWEKGLITSLVLLSILTQVFYPWRCENWRVIQQQFLNKTMLYFRVWGQNILWSLLHIFKGVRTPNLCRI